jgi:hypothetical protein
MEARKNGENALDVVNIYFKIYRKFCYKTHTFLIKSFNKVNFAICAQFRTKLERKESRQLSDTRYALLLL